MSPSPGGPPGEVPGWVADPALRPVWERVRDRFERAGLVPTGRVRVTAVAREEKHALGALLGRTITREQVSVDLGDLDHRLRERSGIGGLETVLTAVLGTPPRDRPAHRAARRLARERPLTLAADLVRAPWVEEWVGLLRRQGLLTGRDDAEGLVEQAALVLNHLTGAAAKVRPEADVTRSRVELGARLLGDAHALDTDRVLHRVVLHGLAAAARTVTPDGARARDELWACFGVTPDLLSRTCLVWRLRARGEGALARRLDLAHETGDPVHVTDWDLRRGAGFSPFAEGQVLVCENPRVLEGVAEEAVDGWTVVCTAGEPNLVVASVLGALADSGAALSYHGDFDWPGIAIANRVVERFRARPWLMDAEDYVRGARPDGPALHGDPVEPLWSAELGAAMRTHDRALHEESVLVELLQRMRGR